MFHHEMRNGNSPILKKSPRLKRRGQLGDDLEQIADQADVSDLEDRRFLVLVDRDDDLRIRHPGEMLDPHRRCGARPKRRCCR